MFLDDPEGELKVEIIQEVMGAAITGLGVRLEQPKAVILWGPDANNGKSQVLELLEFVVPPGCCSHVSPHMLWNGNTARNLVGKLANTSGELRSSGIKSELFKTVITGEPITGKKLYSDEFPFRPIAQHMYGTNHLPPFVGGIDTGVERRVLVVKCSHVIQKHEMISRVAEVIRDTEYGVLLAFAVEGARRLVRQGEFTRLPSSEEIIAEWIRDTDAVKAWMEECVRSDPENTVGYEQKVVRNAFRAWAQDAGYDWRDYHRLKVDGLRERMVREFPDVKRTAESRHFRGIRILGVEQSSSKSSGNVKDLLDQPIGGTWPTKSVH
jgi:phage/plasmid-associated DNA primase